MREAARLAEQRGLFFESEGTGAAVRQSIDANDNCRAGDARQSLFSTDVAIDPLHVSSLFLRITCGGFFIAADL